MTADNAATRRRPVGARRLMPLIVWGSVALGVLVLILTGEMGNMVDAFSTANWWLVAPLLAVGCALPVVHAKRWQIMLRALEHELSLESTIDLTITSTMINYAAPGYLWSPAKGLLARQMYGIGLGRSVPTLAVEQVVDALALLVGTVVGLILAGPVISREIFGRLDAPSAGRADSRRTFRDGPRCVRALRRLALWPAVRRESGRGGQAACTRSLAPRSGYRVHGRALDTRHAGDLAGGQGVGGLAGYLGPDSDQQPAAPDWPDLAHARRYRLPRGSHGGRCRSAGAAGRGHSGGGHPAPGGAAVGPSDRAGIDPRSTVGAGVTSTTVEVRPTETSRLSKLRSAATSELAPIWIAGILIRLLLMPFTVHSDIYSIYSRSYDAVSTGNWFSFSSQIVIQMAHNAWFALIQPLLPHSNGDLVSNRWSHRRWGATGGHDPLSGVPSSGPRPLSHEAARTWSPICAQAT